MFYNLGFRILVPHMVFLKIQMFCVPLSFKVRGNVDTPNVIIIKCYIYNLAQAHYIYNLAQAHYFQAHDGNIIC